MPKTSRDANVAEMRAGISSAFQRLLGLLKVPVPVAAAVSVAVILGSTTVKIQSFELPRMLAALSATVLLIVIYIGCYKATLTFLRFLEALVMSGNEAEVERQSVAIKSETSVLNPFSSTRVSPTSESSIIDYIGLITIHLPIAVVLITSTWVLSDVRRDTARALEAIERHEAALAASQQVPEGITRKDVAIYLAREEVDKAAANMGLGYLYFILRGVFVVLYGYFLYRIWQVTLIVNSDDAPKRLAILVVSLLVLLFPMVIVDIMWNIRTISFMVKTW
jgi:hypothetical protein